MLLVFEFIDGEVKCEGKRIYNLKLPVFSSISSLKTVLPPPGCQEHQLISLASLNIVQSI